MKTDFLKDVLQSLEHITVADALDVFGVRRNPTFPERVLPVAAGFASGLAVGATLAILFTPRTGRDIRHIFEERIEALLKRSGINRNGGGFATPADKAESSVAQPS